MKKWTLTRSDGLNILSRDEYETLDALAQSLRNRGIALTDAHVTEIAAHPDTQFERQEMVTDAATVSAYSARVVYDIRPSADIPPPRPAPRSIKCRSCGTVGHAGSYPFSTLPADMRTCDDCA